MDDLGARRTRRWWQVGRPIRSIGRAGAFVDDVGFALLFPTAAVGGRRFWLAGCWSTGIRGWVRGTTSARHPWGGGPPGRRDAACQRPATGGGAAPGGRAGGRSRRRARFSAVVVELGRALVCTSFATEQVGTGWPSAVLELTARAFDLGGGEADEAARRRRVGRRFLGTMLVASGRVSWPAPSAGRAPLPAPRWRSW